MQLNSLLQLIIRFHLLALLISLCKLELLSGVNCIQAEYIPLLFLLW